MLSSVRRIVLGADLGETLPDALREAALVATTYGAEITMVHAIPEAPEHSPDYDAVAGEAERLLDELRASHPDVRISAAHRIRAQDAASLVLSTADDIRADLIVIGAGQRTTLDKALLGTTAEKVLSRSRRPVWVVRPGRAHPELRRILCAIDGSEPAREALSTSAFLARTFVAELTLLTVVGTSRQPAGGDALEPLTREVDLHAIQLSRVMREGRPSERIVEVAEESRADLLVLGSAGRTGLSRLLLGRNTAEQVIRQLPCSLLAIPAAGATT